MPLPLSRQCEQLAEAAIAGARVRAEGQSSTILMLVSVVRMCR